MKRRERNRRRSSRRPLPGRGLGLLPKGAALSCGDYPSSHDALSLEGYDEGRSNRLNVIRFNGFFVVLSSFPAILKIPKE